MRSDIEYDVNLKAELEIAHLHDKLDRLTGETLGRLEKDPEGACQAFTREHSGAR